MLRVTLAAFLAAITIACVGRGLSAQEAVADLSDARISDASTPFVTAADATEIRPAAPRRDSILQEEVSRRVSQPPPILPERMIPTHLVNRAMTVMGLLIAASIASIWYGQRYTRMGRLSRSGPKNLEVVETLSIAPRCCMHLLQVGPQKYLVARDQTGIKSVTPVSDFAVTLEELDGQVADSSRELAIAGSGNEVRTNRRDPWTGSKPNR